MNQLQFMFAMIVCIIGVVIGLALLGPMNSVIDAGTADMNCSSGANGDSGTKFTCAITGLLLPWFVIGIFLGITGLIVYRRYNPPQDYGYDQGYPQQYQQY